ncbi:MAG: PilZ domain-containing protein [Leptospiraceae bacterium]|nr:PilZ domain-containing protein [Leptospiraceae bacterium]MCP5493901.1 PilZ domain-containing protein [Leptospiraceae bacterium]
MEDTIEKRKYERIVKEFKDYKVYIEFNSALLEGRLGDISEKGMCILFPKKMQLLAGQEINAALIHRTTKNDLKIQGKIAWIKNKPEYKENPFLCGVEFDVEIELPDDIIAISYAAGFDI